jgi:hypothetical protein
MVGTSSSPSVAVYDTRDFTRRIALTGIPSNLGKATWYRFAAGIRLELAGPMVASLVHELC